MDRRAWLKLAGSSLAAGLSGCGGGVAETRAPTVNRRLVASYGGAGFGIWQDGRLLDGEQLGNRLGSLSLTKAVAGLAVTRAVAEGWLSPDAPLGGELSEWRGDPAKSRITVRMLVNQSAGLAPSPTALYHGVVPDKGRVALQLPLLDSPGTRFRYGPVCWEVLAELMHRKLKAQGSTLESFVSRLTGRIGASSPEWRSDGKGRFYLSTGAEFSVRDLGRVGRVIGKLAAGENEAGLDAAVFHDLSSPRAANPMFGAGIWWNRNARKSGAFAVEPEKVLDGVHAPSFWNRACLDPQVSPLWLALVGSGGKRIYVLPGENLVIARLGRSYSWSDRAFLASLNA
ncbi:MAG: beta-lactamase family protein [Akkermansiaceae bacterium]|nr:beta-lactamase family protein [Akkermansiaceae bacterium]MCP5547717.1 beta-lactamase family protein [Akkermansiaceae bacterium]